MRQKTKDIIGNGFLTVGYFSIAYITGTIVNERMHYASDNITRQSKSIDTTIKSLSDYLSMEPNLTNDQIHSLCDQLKQIESMSLLDESKAELKIVKEKLNGMDEFSGNYVDESVVKLTLLESRDELIKIKSYQEHGVNLSDTLSSLALILLGVCLLNGIHRLYKTYRHIGD